jgi:hypothetical protein
VFVILDSPCWNLAFPIGFDPLYVMPLGDHMQRGRSCKGGFVDRHTQSVMVPAAEAYEAHAPPHIRAKLDLANVYSRVILQFVDHDVVDAEIGQWISDPGSYRKHATLYTKTVDLCYYKFSPLEPFEDSFLFQDFASNHSHVIYLISHSTIRLKVLQ